MGCKVIQVGEEPLCDLKPMVEQRKLQWNDVAYIGKQLHLIEVIEVNSECVIGVFDNYADTRFLLPCNKRYEQVSPTRHVSFYLSGNDKPDVKLLNLAGLSAVPGDAPTVAINAAKYTCHSIGGKGAMREFAEYILLQKQKAKSQMKQDRIDCSSF